MRSGTALLLLGVVLAGALPSHASKDKETIVDFPDTDSSVKGHWALLVAGSAGWGNYRHQADVFHAYHVLINGGFSPHRIVVMAYDDVAHDPENPTPGKVFNKPGGPDVYQGVHIDYRGEDVNSETFLAVLEGRAPAVANKGSGRVIASGPHDRVFLFYSDHGAAGVLGMPSGNFLYADQLMKALQHKAARHGFKEMVMYIEACESGSMFEGLLDDNSNIYVTTAANSMESSWATYCPTFFKPAPPSTTVNSVNAAVNSNGLAGGAQAEDYLLQVAEGIVAEGLRGQQGAPGAAVGRGLRQWQWQPTTGDDPPPGPEMTTCLGDLYSVSWMENSDEADLTSETLLQQYKLVKLRTSNNFTYNEGSHVMQYGALDIDHEPAANYIGSDHTGNVTPSKVTSVPASVLTRAQLKAGVAGWKLWLIQWLRRAAQLLSPGESDDMAGALDLIMPQSSLDRSGRSLQHMHPHGSAHVHGDHHHSHQQQLKRQQAKSSSAAAGRRHHAKAAQRHADLLPLMHRATGASCPRRRAAALRELAGQVNSRKRVDALAAVVGSQLLRGQPGGGGGVANGGAGRQPVVRDWECLRGMVQAWGDACGPLREYGMRHTRLLAGLCNKGAKPQQLHQLLQGVCLTGASRQQATHATPHSNTKEVEAVL